MSEYKPKKVVRTGEETEWAVKMLVEVTIKCESQQEAETKARDGVLKAVNERYEFYENEVFEPESHRVERWE